MLHSLVLFLYFDAVIFSYYKELLEEREEGGTAPNVMVMQQRTVPWISSGKKRFILHHHKDHFAFI